MVILRRWVVIGSAVASVLAAGCGTFIDGSMASRVGAPRPVSRSVAAPAGMTPASNLVSVKGASPVSLNHLEVARFAAGCFWGVEDYFRREPGVLATAVGFSGGHTENPTYLQVCSGQTGHAESVEVEFDTSRTSYSKLLQLFFEIHDPTAPITQLDVSPVKRGFQSSGRSMVFYRTTEQKEAALKTIAALERSIDFKGLRITTEVVPAGAFYRADERHQQYIEKGGQASCHPLTKRYFGK